MSPSSSPPSSFSTSCWKCHGEGWKHKRVHKAVLNSTDFEYRISNANAKQGDLDTCCRSKTQVVFVPCSNCSRTGFTTVTPLTKSSTTTCSSLNKRGLVRPFKPPAGWKPAGPEPFLSIDSSNAESAMATLLADLKTVHHHHSCVMLTALCGKWSIFQLVDGHRYTTDDLCTAAMTIRHFQTHLVHVLPRPKRHVDIGCGLGSVLNFLAWKFNESLEFSLGIEAQEAHVELARKTLIANAISSHCKVVHGDLQDFASSSSSSCISSSSTSSSPLTTVTTHPAFISKSQLHSFDLVTGTPPYFPSKHGILPSIQNRGMCSFEIRGGIETYAIAASHLLAKTSTARFVVVQTALEVVRSILAFEGQGLLVLEQFNFYGKVGRKDPLFVVFVCGWNYFSSSSGSTTNSSNALHSDVFVRDVDGKYTQEYREILQLVGKPPPPV